MNRTVLTYGPKRYTLLLSLALAVDFVHCQSTYTFGSTPDSAIVLMNGVERCRTPCAVDFRWNENVDQRITFTVSLEGYEPWSDTLKKKAEDLDEFVAIELERAITRIATVPDHLIDLDKVITTIKNGATVGTINRKNKEQTPILWNANAVLKPTELTDQFLNACNEAGLPTPRDHAQKLFQLDQRSRTPRYMVGAELTEYIERLSYSGGNSHGTGKVISQVHGVVEWKIFDLRRMKVVGSWKKESRIRCRQKNWEPLQHGHVLFDNMIAEFINDQQIQDFLSTPENNMYSGSEEVIEVGPTPSRTVARSKNEIIQGSERSCATVITDQGHGSGVVVDPEGYMITTYHVIHDAKGIEVLFSNGLRLTATVVRTDPESDVALLDVVGSGYPSIPISSAPVFTLGAEVFTIGSPADIALGQSVSQGIISGRRTLDRFEFLQTDLAVNPGNSGGPLINEKGEVIGIVQSKLVGKGIEGLGFAVPMEVVMERLRLRSRN